MARASGPDAAAGGVRAGMEAMVAREALGLERSVDEMLRERAFGPFLACGRAGGKGTQAGDCLGSFFVYHSSVFHRLVVFVYLSMGVIKGTQGLGGLVK